MDDQRALTGHCVLVTGGARRVGAAIARHLGERGARIVVHAHRAAAEAEALAAELTAGSLAVAADLRSPGGAAALFATLDRAGVEVDTVVHAAASFLRVPALETTAEMWDEVLALNLRAFHLLTRELVARRGQMGGNLIAIADVAALELWPGYLAHSVSKAALLALVKGLAKALAPRYRVNAVIPGPVMPPDGTSPAELERIRNRTLLGRLGEPRHVAEAVDFLLRCDYATGATIEVTGGSELWRPAGRQTALPNEPGGRVDEEGE